MAALYPSDHSDACACSICMPDAELIHVGLPFQNNIHNGYAIVKESDGEVLLLLSGEGQAKLSMPPQQAMELRTQLDNTINSLR